MGSLPYLLTAGDSQDLRDEALTFPLCENLISYQGAAVCSSDNPGQGELEVELFPWLFLLLAYWPIGSGAQ